MKWNNWGVKGGVALVLMTAMVGCAPIHPVTPEVEMGSAAGATAAPALEVSYDEPFAYCAAVGTVDEPDERYTGEPLPDVIAEGVRAAFNAEDVDLEVFQRGTVWRCMDGKVYACNVGANIPCQVQADLSREPNEAIVDYCQENRESDFIPAVVTGRATIYNWGCEEGEPVIVESYTEVDGQGFLEFAWHELAPPE